MYFKSRAEAGELLADQLMQYRYENCAVVALTTSSVATGEPIAARLHAVLGMFLSEPIPLPGENMDIGTVDQGGAFIYDTALSEGEQSDYYSEFHGYIDDQKREKFQKINELIGEGGAIRPEILQAHVIILVADGLKSIGILEAAAEFLKPIKYQRLVIATPLASVSSIDKMHLMADEIHCLHTVDNYLDTQHYYDKDVELDRDQAITKINNVILNWR